ncbi:hypothetical protein EDB92DRAFT_1387522 [Lactarius akahatsu]|uniref:Uncharacterized protein n=1 Tax=Lactarius akahatsu TaxID=416441 RepID=A0AAD4LA39_9AGAM|nr:hypothetical protein EDB92DRAFT_1387522 [Lactarius akahatsu]
MHHHWSNKCRRAWGRTQRGVVIVIAVTVVVVIVASVIVVGVACVPQRQPHRCGRHDWRVPMSGGIGIVMSGDWGRAGPACYHGWGSFASQIDLGLTSPTTISLSSRSTGVMPSQIRQSGSRLPVAQAHVTAYATSCPSDLALLQTGRSWTVNGAKGLSPESENAWSVEVCIISPIPILSHTNEMASNGSSAPRSPSFVP